MNKEWQFLDWICGVPGARCPFFKDMPEVPYPIGFEEEIPDRLNPDNEDIFDQEEKEDK